MKFSRIFVCASVAVMAMAAATGCDGAGKRARALEAAAAQADSIVSAASDANVEVNADGTGLDATFRMSDSLIDPQYVGQDLFDVFAAQQLKDYPSAAVNAVSKAVQEGKGEITVELLWPGDRMAEFKLSPKRFVELQRAKNSQLNLPAAKTQLIELARHMVPAPKTAEGSSEVNVSINKSFLEYEIVWPDARALDGGQGMLTGRYFNAFKRMYQSLGALGPDVVRMMQSMGIDGVRMAYKTAGSDKTVQQAFPWREIEKPIEESPVK